MTSAMKKRARCDVSLSKLNARLPCLPVSVLRRTLLSYNSMQAEEVVTLAVRSDVLGVESTSGQGEVGKDEPRSLDSGNLRSGD